MTAAGAPGPGTPSTGTVRTVLVTGAGRGIGEATARRFADAGYLVGAYDLQPCAWAEGDERIVTGSLDVTDPAAWEAALTELTARSGGALDVLVNNAGLLYGTPFMDASFEQDAALVDVNVKGVLYGCRAAFPFLEKSATPTVVNLCSASAIYGQAEMATYSATKFAVRGITEALDLEWARHGIRVCSVWPLYVGTGMLEGVNTTGMRTMGVRFTEGDVAGEILDLAEQTARESSGVFGRIRRALGREVHRPVGKQATAMYLASQVAPSRLVKLSNQRLTS